MGLMTFFKDAGEKLFGKGPTKAAQEAAAAAPSPETIEALNATAAKAIADHVAAQWLSADGLDIAFDGRQLNRHGGRHRGRPGHEGEDPALRRQRARRGRRERRHADRQQPRA